MQVVYCFVFANREEGSLNNMDGLAVTVGYQYCSEAIIDDSVTRIEWIA